MIFIILGYKLVTQKHLSVESFTFTGLMWAGVAELSGELIMIGSLLIK